MANPYRDLNEEIFDHYLKGQVNLMRYSESTRREVEKILMNAQEEIIKDLSSADATKRMTEWKRDRLAKVSEQIDGIFDRKYAEISRVSKRDLGNIADTVVKGDVRTLNKLLQTDIFDVTLTQNDLQALAENTMIDGRVIGDWWNDHGDTYKKKFRRQLNNTAKAIQMGTIRGEAVGEIIRKVRGTKTKKGLIDNAKQNAQALVRTSTMTVANESRFKMYRSNGDLIDGYQWMATLDNRTTQTCMAYDGKVWLEKDGAMVPDGHGMWWPGPPPAHWGCRSTLVPILKSFAELAGPNSKLSKKKLKRLDRIPKRTRASMGGPIPMQNYGTWLEAQSVAMQKEILGPKRWKLWQKYDLSMTDLVHQDGRPLLLNELREKLGVGATIDDVKDFREMYLLDGVGDSRIKRAIDNCYY